MPAWLEVFAENLQDGATAEVLQAICGSSILAGFKQSNRLWF